MGRRAHWGAQGSHDGESAGKAGAELLESVYLEHRDGVVRMCAVLLRNLADAEDAAQEAFARAAPAILAGTCNPGPYVYMAARNLCRDILRQRGRRDVRELSPELEATTPLPDAVVLAQSSFSQIWEALSVRDRMLLGHTLAGFRYTEIAQRFGLSPKVVSVGLTRARGRLRRSLEAMPAVIGVLPGWARWRLRRRWEAARGSGRDIWQILTSRAFGEAASVIASGCLLCGVALNGTAPPPPTVPGGPANQPDVAIPAAAPVIPFHQRLVARAAPSRPRSGLRGAVPRRASGQPSIPPPSEAVGNLHVNSVVASPSYGRDQTLFAEGDYVFSGAPAVFESADDGATWTRKAAIGFGGGSIMMSPSWATDHRLFAGTDTGLQESDDAGATWSTLAAVPGSIAIASDPSGTGVRVAIAGSILWTYSTATHTLTPGPRLPLGVIAVGIAFAGDADHVVLAETGANNAIARCDLTASCSTVTTFDAGPVTVVSAAEGPSPTVLALGGYRAYVSHDGGLSFRQIDAPMGQVDSPMGLPEAVAMPPAGSGLPPLVGWTGLDGTTERHGIAALNDGNELTPMPATIPMPTGISAVLPLPGGRLLAVQQWGSTELLSRPIAWWSDDGGRSWATSTGT